MWKTTTHTYIHNIKLTEKRSRNSCPLFQGVKGCEGACRRQPREQRIQITGFGASKSRYEAHRWLHVERIFHPRWGLSQRHQQSEGTQECQRLASGPKTTSALFSWKDPLLSLGMCDYSIAELCFLNEMLEFTHILQGGADMATRQRELETAPAEFSWPNVSWKSITSLLDMTLWRFHVAEKAQEPKEVLRSVRLKKQRESSRTFTLIHLGKPVFHGC